MRVNSQDYIIGIDIGTGSCKAVAVAVNGKKLAVSKSYYPTHNPQPGYAEQDPEEIWQAFATCCRDILKKSSRPPVAVSLSSAMHGLILIDKRHMPLTPLIIWADRRSEQIADELKNDPSGRDIYNATGTPLFSMSPLCKIIWFKKNEPAMFHRAARFVSVKEYIWFRLFNKWQIDLSIASATGLLNIQSKKWHEPSLLLCGITTSQLSALSPTTFMSTDINKEIAKSIGFTTDTVFCIGASDGCLANLGSFALEPAIGALTIGTSGAVRIASPKPLNNYESMLFNYILDDDIYISGGPINNGGIVLKWLLKTFRNINDPETKDYDQLFKMIENIPAGSEGLVFLPYLLGERGPVWNANASALFFGIRYTHGQAHFLRAGVEGICFALRSILESLQGVVSDIEQLNVSGGFVNSPAWIQILADITGKKLCTTEKKDASATGAAMLAMKKLGLIAQYNSLEPTDPGVFLPDQKNRQVYDDAFGIYRQLYGSVKNLMNLPLP